MKKNNNALLRLASAAVLIALCLAAIWWLPPLGFALLCLCLAVVVALEWGQILGYGLWGRCGLALGSVGLCALLAGLGAEALAFAVALGIVGFGLTLLCTGQYLRGYYRAVGSPDSGAPSQPGALNRALHSVAALLLISSCWQSLVYSQQLTDKSQLLLLFALVWLSDSAAYVGGKSFGGKKLMPAISPSKTWAGLLSSLLACALLSFVVGLGWWGILLWAAAVWGDAYESVLKRQYRVKDSGALIPGHGGLLDRIDSLLLAAVAWNFLLMLQAGG